MPLGRLNRFRLVRSGAEQSERVERVCLRRASIRKTGWKRDHGYNQKTTWPGACVF